MRDSNLKPSNHNCIGEIPYEWNIKKLKYVVQKLKSGGTPDSSNPDYYTDEDSGIKWLSIGDMSTNDFVYDTKNRITYNGVLVKKLNIFPIGTIVYSIYATIGKVSELGTEAAINQAILAITPKKELNKDFLKFSLKSLEDYAISLTSESTQKNLNANKVENFPIVFPQLREQVLIASFLDQKCSNIDSIISDLEKQIDILEKYKKSVISEAVTKGLNPDVEMKNGGTIGKLPEHWKVTKLGYVFTFLGGNAYSSEQYVPDSKNQLIRIGNVKDFNLMLEASPAFISDEIAKSTNKFKLKSGNILFTMTGTKGKRDYFFTHLLTSDDIKDINLYLNQRVGCLIPKKNVHANYFNYLLKDELILDSVFIHETGTANQGNLGIDSIKRTLLHLPPLIEQKEISTYLDKKCFEIDSVIKGKQKQLEIIKTYKNSLIYEYVTGKKRVGQGDVNE